jgi:hypothetical protein
LRVRAVNSLFSAASSTIITARPFAIPASLRQDRENVDDLSIRTLDRLDIAEATCFEYNAGCNRGRRSHRHRAC